MLTIKFHSSFKKDYKRVIGLRVCHITPKWLLVYEIDQEELILLLTRTGTHSDLF
ncbi:type II toxin-antitoxin system mRNA interferase toxin, RelE/StbE family [Clostridium sp. AM58-1XD]|uniref:type II toxin-antitoxin system RelE/ParE family toxin n=1 Tax=Clostridium sp. AM58-1XD TaxID=2292307 RepID=UPI000E54C00B|nr:type II toxin-antitoxin system mRNA interferase toxin, RelE/StbE family [Clostridium sp. AM58-1XD]RGY98058.1 type II toxin-antitoxin system mRNA interferase toxin, RelE/StbE family [Clostridium sp. AM58-1XD]